MNKKKIQSEKQPKPETGEPLKKQIRNLEKEKKRAKERAERLTDSLRERVKELDCLYGISRLAEESSSLDEILTQIPELVRNSWQYPETACSRLEVDKREYKSANFRRSKYVQKAPIRLNQKKIGMLEVYYRRKMPDADEGPFLKEERELLNTLAKRLSHIIESKRTQEQLTHLTDTLLAIRNVNQLITREEDKCALIQKICDNLIDTRGYESSWICLLDQEKNLVHFTQSGLNGKSSDLINAFKSGYYPPCIKKNIKKKGIVIFKAPEKDCAGCPLQRNHKECTAICIPILHNDTVFGYINLYTPIPRVANQEEQSLLLEVANDIGFALFNIDMAAAHKAAEAQRQQSEFRFNATVEQAPFPVMLHAQDGEVIFVNKVWINITGYSSEEIKTIDQWTALAYGKQKETVETDINALYAISDSKDEGEYTIRCKDGSTRIWDFSSSPVGTTPDGRRLVVSMAKDVTEHKKAEERVQDIAKFPSENSNPVLRIDHNGTILYANAASAPLLTMWQTRTGQRAPDNWHQIVTHVLGTATMKVIDTTCGNREFQVAAMPVPESGYVNLYATDITERKHAEQKVEKANRKLQASEQQLRAANQQLRASEQQLRAANQQLRASEQQLRQSKDRLKEAQRLAEIGNWEWDFETDKLFLSDQMYEIIGLDKDNTALDIATHEKYYTPESWKTFKQTVESARLTGKPYEIELELVRENEANRTVVARGEPLLDKTGKTKGFQGTLQDITRQKKAREKENHLREQLQQSQKLEAIGTLAGGVAHDFNNMLTVIQGNVQYLATKTDQNSPVQKLITNISKAGERASNLTRQLLLYSRRESMNYTLFSPNQTIEELLKMLKRLIGENITIKTGFDSGLTELCADQGNFEQIIMNMAVNARDAMPEGGTLTISTTHLAEVPQTELPPSATQPAAGPHARITVADTGCGMDDETRRHIFDPFYTTKKRGQGTGLGLSVVHGIVKEHNGWIRVHSRPNAGTTFDIFLPLNLEKHKAGQDKEISDKIIKSKANGRILLVEDDRQVREITQLILTDAEYSVTAAENAEQASELFSEQNMAFDLVFSDTILPGKNGIDLIEDLQNKKPELKALLGSGYSGDRTQHDLIKKRNIPFIRKPYKMKNLLETVHQVLSE